jgi:hypothetical protein
VVRIFIFCEKIEFHTRKMADVNIEKYADYLFKYTASNEDVVKSLQKKLGGDIYGVLLANGCYHYLIKIGMKFCDHLGIWTLENFMNYWKLIHDVGCRIEKTSLHIGKEIDIKPITNIIKKTHYKILDGGVTLEYYDIEIFLVVLKTLQFLYGENFISDVKIKMPEEKQFNKIDSDLLEKIDKCRNVKKRQVY